MLRPRDLPLQRKLIALGLVTTLLALSVSATVFLISTYVVVRRGVTQDIAAQADIVAENETAALAFSDRVAAAETLHALRAMRKIDVACVYDLHDQVFATYRALASLGCPEPPPAASKETMGASEIVRPIVQDQRRLGTLYVRGNFSAATEELNYQMLAAAGAGAIGVLCAILVATWLQRVITRPIDSLAATAAAIRTRGDYTLRAQKVGEDETGALVDAFNGMLDEIARRDEQVRTASRLKDDFLATVSHELRTPLNAILGWLQMLRMRKADAPMLERALAVMERNARVQARLIEDLLDVSRIVSGKLRLRSTPVDLNAAVDAAVEVTRPVADAKGVALVCRIPPETLTVIGDSDRLQQVVWNLLSNAVKFTPNGGRVEIMLSSTDHECQLTVRDTGIGIAPEFLPHVFDRFRQADGSSTRQHGGIGVGLAIVRELVQMHGGRVEASSEGPGRGALFIVHLPCAPEGRAQRLEAGQPRLANLSGVSVLVIDDDPDARDVATTALETSGARVTRAGSAAEGLDMLIQEHPDVLVCDLAMPQIDGYEFLRRVREREIPLGLHTPAIAVTAYAGADDRARASVAGYDGFVAKPYDFATLVGTVAAVRTGI